MSQIPASEGQHPDLRQLFHEAPWTQSQLPGIEFPPGCLQPNEARLLYHLARDMYRGHGVIADCGAFLGKSASLFAQGLRDNPLVHPIEAVVHSFDCFIAHDSHDVEFVRLAGSQVSTGDSTRSIYEKLVSPWADLIKVHEGDFTVYDWPKRPIEILFIDICKTPELNARVLTQLFPCLSPGDSVIVQQDYHHPHHPVIHMSLEVLSDSLEYLATRVDDSCVFSIAKEIPTEKLEEAATVHLLPADDQLLLMNAAIERLPSDEQHIVKLARAVLIGGLHGEARMREEIDVLESTYSSVDDPLWQANVAAVKAVCLSTRYREVWGLHSSGDAESFAAAAHDLASERPGDLEPILMQSVALRASGLAEEAIRTLEQARDRGNPRLLQQLGEARLAAGDLPGALAATQEAESKIVLIPQSGGMRASNLTIMAHSLFGLGRVEESETAMRTAVEAEPTNAWALRYWALALRELGRENEAKQQIGRARELDPSIPGLG